MRIGYLIGQYPAVNHTFILSEIRHLRALGFDVHVASISPCDRDSHALTGEEREEAASTFYVKHAGIAMALRDHCETLFSNPGSYLRGLGYALRLARWSPGKAVSLLLYFAEAVVVGRWMRREKITHLHTHFSSTVTAIAKQVFPVDVSMTIHGSGEFVDPKGFYIMEKIEASSFVCAISDYGRSQLMLASEFEQWPKIEVAPLGIDISRFRAGHDTNDKEHFEILCVGRLVPAKAQHMLITALNLLLREGRNVLLRLVGDGPDRQSLENDAAFHRISSHVIFDGRLNQDQVLQKYRQADVFVLPSFAEGVPVVLMEAMAMEIPCIASRITGIPELIRNGIDGLLVSPSNMEELAEAIRRIMDDPELRKRLGRAGRQRVAERYDLTRNVNLLAKIFMTRVRTAPQQAGQGRLVYAQQDLSPTRR